VTLSDVGATAEVPEPASASLLGVLLCAGGLMVRGRRRLNVARRL
jgi:hypothetical protein